tara:strand:- start:564 stop:767 length:204 start_codon:yes stop_codon:yes gene_type:complete
MGFLGGWEIILVVIVVLVIFGSKRLPEMGSSLRKAIWEFKNAGKEIQNDVGQTTSEKSSDINPKEDV